MPRLARLDAPGVFHHIIIRGIERRKIFRDDRDRENFFERLRNLLLETKTGCYAWAFLPNHAHFLLRTGKVPLATVMRRLLTGYVVSFNRRYKRHGHLLQNRYKSIGGKSGGDLWDKGGGDFQEGAPAAAGQRTEPILFLGSA
jgi:putative transposase